MEMDYRPKRSIECFGDLEIRCLITITNISEHFRELINDEIVRKVSKVVAFLSKEIISQFRDKSNAAKYIHFLTVLLQILLFERCLIS